MTLRRFDAVGLTPLSEKHESTMLNLNERRPLVISDPRIFNVDIDREVCLVRTESGSEGRRAGPALRLFLLPSSSDGRGVSFDQV